MANIQKLEMTKLIPNNGLFIVKKGFLGFGTKTMLKDSGCPVSVVVKEYNPADGDKMERVLNMERSKMAEELSKADIQTTDMGNAKLEVIKSDDGTFLMMQLFRFSDFKYRPVSEVITITGPDADRIGKLI